MARASHPIALVALLGALLSVAACTATSAYRGPRSDHFDGERFTSLPPAHVPTGSDLFQWQLTRNARPYPRRIDDVERLAPPTRVTGDRMRVTLVNHATTLIQQDGLNILTDPIWSERPSPLSWVGPKRVRAPGVAFDDLPPIDVVVISHNHYDHLDLPTLVRLFEAHRPRFFVGLGVKALLVEAGIAGVFELDWWGTAALSESVRLHCVPTRHFSNRAVSDSMATLFCGWVTEGPSGRAYFAGDTGYGPHFRAIGARLGPLRAALLPIGAYEPRWFMHDHHLAPEDAVQAHEDLGATTSIAMHHGTFDLSDEAEIDPEIELMQELARRSGAGPVARVHLLANGEGEDVPAPSR